MNLGQKVDGPVPGLGLNHLISTEGELPPPGGNGGFPPTGQYVGQVIAYAGPQARGGWALCDGMLLRTTRNHSLYHVIGTNYGGDGRSTFALPDLRGRMIVGRPG